MSFLIGSMTDFLWSDLRTIITTLRNDGGLMSPSVYDTAQALRFCPPLRGELETVDWLLEQQHPDGGWGDPAAPKTRDVPTLASILALHAYQDKRGTGPAIQDGLAFLHSQAPHWQEPLSDDLPVGVELILPRLLEDAAELNLNVPQDQYGNLVPLGNRKRQQIAKLNPGAGTPAAFSWEAWGTVPEPRLLDESGGVGHNPAATAWWLRLAGDREDLAKEIDAARFYLEQASAATRTSIPGVMPTAWPIDRYEQSFVLHTLTLADLLDHPLLEDVVEPQLRDLAGSLRPNGVGFSDYFTPDGDDTAAAIAALKAYGISCDLRGLETFRKDGHILGYHGEFQGSHSLTARAIHAMILFGKDVRPLQDYLLKHQLPDGRWPGDKWHTSWLYATFLAVYALRQNGADYIEPLQAAIDAIEAYQNMDGGWGPDGRSIVTDTAYAALTMYVVKDILPISWYCIESAYQWLREHYEPFDYNCEPTWLNKQQYSPYRIDWGFALSAMLVLDGMMLHDNLFGPIPARVSSFAS